MTCSPELLQAYLDEELDTTQRLAIESHIAECKDCSAAWDRLRIQRSAIRAEAPYYAAPPELRQSIRNALRDSAAMPIRAPARPQVWRGLAVAACLLLAASITWNVIQLARPDARLSDTIVAGHIRSLLASHLVDVPSSDRHTVKPWFAGQLDFSPVLLDLAAEGFPLAGGRIDYLNGRRVAAVVYRRGLHVINLFEWPSATPGGESRFSTNGYNVVHWTNGGMTYWVVSDVAASELERFRQAYLMTPR
jgi:anti-sigma factor RsiW